MNRRSFIASLLASTVVPLRLPTGQHNAKLYISTTTPSIASEFDSLDWVQIGQVVAIGEVGYVDTVGDIGYRT